MAHPLIQIAGRVGEGLAEDSRAAFDLRETRRYIEILRRKAAAEARTRRGVRDRTVWLINRARERESELAASVVGWDRMLPLYREAFTGGRA